MKTVQEIVDGEKYFEISLSKKEYESLRNYMIVCQEEIIFDKKINLGVKVELDVLE